MADDPLRSALDAVAGPPPAGQEVETARRSVQHATAVRRARRRLAVVAGSAAAAVLLLVVGVLALPSDDEGVLDTVDAPSGEESTVPPPPGTATPGTVVAEPGPGTVPDAPPTSDPGTQTSLPPFASASVPPPSTPAPPVARADDVRVTVVPDAPTVEVGGRIEVEVVVENRGAVPHTVTTGSSSCPELARVVAGPAPDPAMPTDWAGNPFVAPGGSMAAVVPGSDQFTGVWTLSPSESARDLDDPNPSVMCTADLRIEDIRPGERRSQRFVLVAFVGRDGLPPGGRLWLTATATVDGRSQPSGTSGGTLAPNQGTAMVTVVEAGPRAGVDAVYAALDADPQVRAYLDRHAGAQLLSDLRYSTGQWRLTLLPFGLAGGPVPDTRLVVVLDGASAQVVSVAEHPRF